MEAFKAFWTFPLFSFGDGTVIRINQLVLVLGVLLVGYIISKVIERIIRKQLANTGMRADAAHVLQRIVFYVLLLIVVMTALSLLRVPLTAFAFVSGAVAIGVGFGAQNIINNFISGWILLMERPVRINDFIEIDGYKGVVERIGNRSTRIRRVDGVHLLMPNSQMLERVVINWTLIDHQIRSTVRVGVAYGSPLRKVADLILQAVTERPEVQNEPAPSIFLEDYGDNAVIFDAYFWCEVGSEGELRKTCSAIRFRLDELFSENNIVIAYPQRDLHMDTLSPLEIKLVSADKRPDE